MRILVYGAGVIGTIYSARLHDAGHDVSLLARGERLTAIREHGVRVAEGESPIIRKVGVPVIDTPAGTYDLTLVFVRSHQVDAVLESIAELNLRGAGDSAGDSSDSSANDSGDVLFLLNWAGGPEPLGAVIGPERVLLSFPTQGGTMDGDIVRYRPTSLLTRLVTMPIGEPDGRATARQKRIVQLFGSAGFTAKAEPRMDAWLKTHAAFEVPLGQAVHAAGGLESLAGDTNGIRDMIRHMRLNLGSLPTRPAPGAFSALRVAPEWMLVPVFRRFLRSSAALPLSTDSPAVTAELDTLAAQLHGLRSSRAADSTAASTASQSTTSTNSPTTSSTNSSPNSPNSPTTSSSPEVN